VEIYVGQQRIQRFPGWILVGELQRAYTRFDLALKRLIRLGEVKPIWLFACL
jgi:hypothetical protein